jgi:hypothetical protein
MDIRVKIGLSIVGLLCVCAMGYWAITYRSEARARATQFSWMRAQAIQQWQTVRHEGWDMPADGRLISTDRRVHHYDRIPTGSHQMCSGSGKTRTCTTVIDYTSYPVYHDWHTYDRDEWVTVRTPTMEGNDQSPIWPDVSDLRTAHDPPQIGDERAGMRTSRYTIVLKGKDTSYTLDITEARWLAFEQDAYYTVVLNILGQPLDIHEQAAALAVRY